MKNIIWRVRYEKHVIDSYDIVIARVSSDHILLDCVSSSHISSSHISSSHVSSSHVSSSHVSSNHVSSSYYSQIIRHHHQSSSSLKKINDNELFVNAQPHNSFKNIHCYLINFQTLCTNIFVMISNHHNLNIQMFLLILISLLDKEYFTHIDTIWYVSYPCIKNA